MNKKIQTLIKSFMVSSLSLSFLAPISAFAEEEESQDSNSTTLQMLVPGYDTGYLAEPLDNAVQQYQEENPEITIEIVSAGWDELNSKIVQLYQAGQAPDIMLVGSRSIRQFAELGVLEDLSPYMTDEFIETRIENVMDTAKIEDIQYGIPLALSSRALFYRSDIVETPPTNWQELKETAEQIKNEEDMYGFAIPTDSRNGVDEMLTFFYQNEGRMVDEEGNYTLNTPENVQTLEYLVELADFIPEPVGTKRDDQVQMFGNGDLAMFISGGWELEELDANAENAPYAAALVPEGKTKAVTLVTDSYVMSSISEKKEAAWKFIEFLGTEDIQRTVSEAYGWLPVTKAELEDERFTTEAMKPMVEILEYGVPEPQVSNWDKFSQSFSIAVQKALTGEASAQEALDTAQEEVTQ
ncbi:sugar ABC transporter substrate-binding protein [Facklamia sp. DSM 111018]|uniref:Sugar ABC transporter substrate-binding protein n=1 Tax=Facklamia lactis TaxID=2749967 RepID=A0ABS0LPI6_9LACT|nr:sugar ABC transporter substrate-binding protein [Facklamia lactis]MBG9980236.1 sugar ABC transporter substrate-binding protein [Facklamia lactis]MBG9986039.1 sugar ABC transporter substrate-binding protein [Facklamia lactis]